jgi:hypothetical protein
MTTFPSEVLDELRYMKPGNSFRYGTTDYTSVLCPEVYDTSRWGIIYRMVFKVEDRFYECVYESGATEMQDYDYLTEVDDYDCDEVFPREVTITEYVQA